MWIKNVRNGQNYTFLGNPIFFVKPNVEISGCEFFLVWYSQRCLFYSRAVSYAPRVNPATSRKFLVGCSSRLEDAKWSRTALDSSLVVTSRCPSSRINSKTSNTESRIWSGHWRRSGLSSWRLKMPWSEYVQKILRLFIAILGLNFSSELVFADHERARCDINFKP